MEDNDLGVAAVKAIKQFAEPKPEHISLGKPLRAILFFAPVVMFALFLIWMRILSKDGGWGILALFSVLVWIGVMGIRVAAQWERALILRFGKLLTIREGGVFYAIPGVDYVRFIDTRTLVLNVPCQKVITKDNVPAQIDGALFFLVTDPEKAVFKIQDFKFAVGQYSQAALRDVVGGLTLDDLLSEREQIQDQIRRIVEDRIKDWGLHIDSIRLLDIELPEELKRMMSRQASAEREKRATITKAEGDKLAAVNLSEAAAIMQKHPGAMQLRSLQTIDGLGPSPSNTVILFPADLNETLKSLVTSLASNNGTDDARKPKTPARKR